jgi:hypothetical protein
MYRRDVIEVEIPEEVEQKLEALRPSMRPKGKPLTKWQEKALLKYWPIRNHHEVARIIGISENLALWHYRRLIAKKSPLAADKTSCKE